MCLCVHLSNGCTCLNKNESHTRTHTSAAVPKLDIFGWCSQSGLRVFNILPYIFNGLAPSQGSWNIHWTQNTVSQLSITVKKKKNAWITITANLEEIRRSGPRVYLNLEGQTRVAFTSAPTHTVPSPTHTHTHTHTNIALTFQALCSFCCPERLYWILFFAALPKHLDKYPQNVLFTDAPADVDWLAPKSEGEPRGLPVTRQPLKHKPLPPHPKFHNFILSCFH